MGTLILINMDEAWPRGETCLPAHPDSRNQQRRLTHVHEHTCIHATRSKRSSQACTNPQHLFFIITIQSAGGKVGLYYAAAVHRLSVQGGLSLTLGLKHES